MCFFLISNCISNCVSSFFVYILVNLKFCYLKAFFSVAFYSNCLDRSYDIDCTLEIDLFYSDCRQRQVMEAVIIRNQHSFQILFYRHESSAILVIGKLFLCVSVSCFWSFSSTVNNRVVSYCNIDYT